MKKTFCILAGILLLLAVLGLFGIIFWGNAYYSDRWYPGTIINGVNVSGQTMEESAGRISGMCEQYVLMIRSRGNQKVTILGTDIAYNIRLGENWEKAFQAQHEGMLFPFAGQRELSVEYDVTYDSKKLENIIHQCKLIQGSVDFQVEAPAAAYAKFDEAKSQYICVAENQGNQIRVPVLMSIVDMALRQGRMEIDLTQEEVYPDVYEVPEVTSDDKELSIQIDLCNNAAIRFVKWDMDGGVTEELTPNDIAKWIQYKDGKIVYNNKKIEEWTTDFCKKYKTVGKSRTIKSHTGKDVQINGGDFGWQMDYEKTLKQVKDSLKQKIEPEAIARYINDPSKENKKDILIKRKASYLNTGFERDLEKNDWDEKNYTEISLKEQKVYVFRKGKVAFSCRCISGLPVEGRKTVVGAFYVKEHRPEYTMTGEDYRTHVKHWVRITWSGTGFHPATWQPWSRWTKTMYQTKGSHGCLNLAPDDAEKIYNMVKYREAVFIHN